MSEESFETTVSSDVEALLQRTIEEKDNLIRRQLKEIKDLKRELDLVFNERDVLLCEVSKLKFELEMTGLKKLQDERVSEEDFAMTSPQINGDLACSLDGAGISLDYPELPGVHGKPGLSGKDIESENGPGKPRRVMGK